MTASSRTLHRAAPPWPTSQMLEFFEKINYFPCSDFCSVFSYGCARNSRSRRKRQNEKPSTGSSLFFRKTPCQNHGTGRSKPSTAFVSPAVIYGREGVYPEAPSPTGLCQKRRGGFLKVANGNGALLQNLTRMLTAARCDFFSKGARERGREVLGSCAGSTLLLGLVKLSFSDKQ